MSPLKGRLISNYCPWGNTPMDIIAANCVIRDSFTPAPPIQVETIPQISSNLDPKLQLSLTRGVRGTGIHGDMTLYREVQTLKEELFLHNKYDSRADYERALNSIKSRSKDLLIKAGRAFLPDFSHKTPKTSMNIRYNQAREKANPVEALGKGIFMDRAALKLAALDAVFHFTGSFSLLTPKVLGNYRYVDLAGGPGGWVQYLQYRWPQAKGIGMTLKARTPQERSLDWNPIVLTEPARFKGEYGPDNSGNLYTNYRWLIDLVDKGLGLVHLTTADGGFHTEGEDQEFLSSRLILIETLLGIALTLPREGDNSGGNFVVKLFDTMHDITAQIVYIASLCFERVTFYKPCTSRPASSEKYLVCWNKRSFAEVKPYINLLLQVADAYREGSLITSFLSTPLPPVFMEWLVQANNILLRNQETALLNIAKALANEPLNLPEIDLHKVLILLALPSQPSERDKALNVGYTTKG